MINAIQLNYLVIKTKLKKQMIKDDPRVEEIRAVTRVYEDFPKKGVNFLDIFPIVANSRTLSLVTDIFIERL